MDEQSLADTRTEKRNSLNLLVENAENLKLKLKNSKNVLEAKKLDEQLTKNTIKTSKLAAEISNLDSKLSAYKNGGKTMNKKVQTGYMATNAAVHDFFNALRTAHNSEEAKKNWHDKLVSNTVDVSGDIEMLPNAVELGIQSALKDNPVYSLFATVAGGTLVCKKFDIKNGAQARGDGYNVVTPKVETDVSLDVKALKQNQIYSLISIGYSALKDLGDDMLNLTLQSQIQVILNKIVDLALYDGDGVGTGTSGDPLMGFDAIVDPKSAAVKVTYDPKVKDLATIVKLNAYRASGNKATTIDASGKDASQINRVLIVNSADYMAIQDSVLSKPYPVTNLSDFVGVDSIIVLDTESTNYEPIVLTRNGYVVGLGTDGSTSSMDKFDSYNIFNNTSQHEVVTMANGTLQIPNSAIVFTVATGA